MTSIPTVSVLTTCYNREAYLAATIESVLAQSFSDYEYIIVDDCSADSTYEIAKRFEKQDSRIKVYKNETNLGDYPNRNKAASLARGKYLKYIDSDDVLYPHALEVCVHYMDQHPNVGLGLTKRHSQEKPLPELLQPKESFQKHFLEQGLFGNAPGSVVIRRETFDNLGAFSGKRLIGDFEMWLKIASHSPVLLLPGFIHWDRKHADQQSACDDIFYATLRHDTAMHALAQDSCPLDARDQKAAIDRLQHQAATDAIRFGLRYLSPFKAARFVRDTKCKLSNLLQVALSARPGIHLSTKKK